MIDEIIVKNSDEISKIKKSKEENAVAIKCLETRIDKNGQRDRNDKEDN
jgi:hypothetical protein